MIAGNSEIRSRYLALALDARRIMDALLPFIESAHRDECLDASVKEAIDALNAISESPGATAVHSNLAFSEYEQVQTLDEIKNQQERKSVIDDLEQIASSPEAEPQQIEAAMRVLRFFFALESRALQHYNRPPAIPAYS
jgi:hypothetical protein